MTCPEPRLEWVGLHSLSAGWKGKAAVGAPSALTGQPSQVLTAQQMQCLKFFLLILFLPFLMQSAVRRLLSDSTRRRHREIQINSPPSSGRSAVPRKASNFFKNSKVLYESVPCTRLHAAF